MCESRAWRNDKVDGISYLEFENKLELESSKSKSHKNIEGIIKDRDKKVNNKREVDDFIKTK